MKLARDNNWHAHTDSRSEQTVRRNRRSGPSPRNGDVTPFVVWYTPMSLCTVYGSSVGDPGDAARSPSPSPLFAIVCATNAESAHAGDARKRPEMKRFRQLSGRTGLRVSSEVPPARSGVYELQISAAVLAMSWSFAISSFSVSAFPRIEVANPHCGLIARRSRSTCCAASRTRAFRTSARSS